MPKIDKVVYTNELNEIKTILKLVMFLNKYFNLVIDTNNTFNDMITKYPEIYNDLETLNNEISRLESKIDNHYNELANNIEINSTNIESNSSSINIINNEITALNRRITTNENNIESNSTNIESNSSSINTINNEITALDRRITTNEGSIGGNSTAINLINSDINTLRNDLGDKLDKTGGTLTGDLNIGQYSLQGSSNGVNTNLIHIDNNGKVDIGSVNTPLIINSNDMPIININGTNKQLVIDWYMYTFTLEDLNTPTFQFTLPHYLDNIDDLLNYLNNYNGAKFICNAFSTDPLQLVLYCEISNGFLNFKSLRLDTNTTYVEGFSLQDSQYIINFSRVKLNI